MEPGAGERKCEGVEQCEMCRHMVMVTLMQVFDGSVVCVCVWVGGCVHEGEVCGCVCELVSPYSCLVWRERMTSSVRTIQELVSSWSRWRGAWSTCYL